MQMKSVRETNRFSREFKRAIRRGKNPEKLFAVAELLAEDVSLPARMRSHKLSGQYEGLWECHIEPDWLLIYSSDDESVVLYRTGSHSDLFR